MPPQVAEVEGVVNCLVAGESLGRNHHQDGADADQVGDEGACVVQAVARGCGAQDADQAEANKGECEPVEAQDGATAGEGAGHACAGWHWW